MNAILPLLKTEISRWVKVNNITNNPGKNPLQEIQVLGEEGELGK